MVCDFIKGKDGVNYLIGLRMMELESHSYEVARTAVNDNVLKPEIHNKKDAILPSQCKLCQLKFNKSELSNKLQLKMLMELKHHLARRGIFLFDHLSVHI